MQRMHTSVRELQTGGANHRDGGAHGTLDTASKQVPTGKWVTHI